VQFTRGTNSYPGYGESPKSWTTGTTPVPIDFYAGYQYDQCFLDEAEWAPPTGTPFAPVTNVVDILDNFATLYPQWESQGFEIAGFVWFHGWNDGLSAEIALAERYGQNMAQFIRQIRAYYEHRYPAHIRPNAPFVLATAAFDGFVTNYPTRTLVANGQLSVDGNAGNYPEFADNVKTMEARGYWRTSGPNMSQGYHYYHNAETYTLVGDALGRGMIELLNSASPTLRITSITVHGTTATITIAGQPNTTCTCKSSADLASFPTTETPLSGSLTTDGNGHATFTVNATPPRRFFRVGE
jgi:alpha-galactosidase